MSKRKEDQPETNDGADAAPEPPAKKGRGRPRSVNPPKEPSVVVPKRSRGRPPKADAGGDKAADDVEEPEPKKSPAKPKKQAKAAVRKSTSPAKRGRGRPKGSGKKKGRGRPPKAAKVEEAADEAEEEEEAAVDAEESS